MKKYITLLAFISCTTARPAAPERTVIEIHPDGTSTVYNKVDSVATIVNLNAEGEMMDSTRIVTDKPLDSVIKDNK